MNLPVTQARINRVLGGIYCVMYLAIYLNKKGFKLILAIFQRGYNSNKDTINLRTNENSVMLLSCTGCIVPFCISTLYCKYEMGLKVHRGMRQVPNKLMNST